MKNRVGEGERVIVQGKMVAEYRRLQFGIQVHTMYTLCLQKFVHVFKPVHILSLQVVYIFRCFVYINVYTFAK